MTTVEKLFVQIFEKKNWIIQQVKQQTDLYNQHLASKLIIDGITPPPWLWNPNFHSQSSDFKELNKEELISELLLPHPRPTIPYSSGHCSLYNKLVVIQDNNGELSNGLFTGIQASNNGFDAGDFPTDVSECCDNDIGCALNCVPELDISASSPQDWKDERIPNSSTAPDQSLARIQRSKSRQQALKLRNSANAAAKRRLSDENNTGFSLSGVTLSGSNSQQADYVNGLVKLAETSNINRESCVPIEAKEGDQCKENGTSTYCGRITRCRSSWKQPSSLCESLKLVRSSEVEKKGGGTLAQSTNNSLQYPNHVNWLLGVANHSGVISESCGAREATTGKYRDKEKDSKVYCSRITRSRSSIQQPSSVNVYSKQDASSSTAKADSGMLAQSIGKLMKQLDDGSELLEAVNPSGVFVGRKTRSQATCSSGCNMDGVNLSIGSDGLVLRPPGKMRMVVKPKHLDLYDMEECNLNNTFSPPFKNRSLEKSSEHICGASLEHAASVDKVISGNPNVLFLEKSLVGWELLSESEEAWRLPSEANVVECVEDEVKKFGSKNNENPMLQTTKDNSEAVLPIQNSPNLREAEVLPSDVHKSSDVDMHQVEYHLTEGCQSSPELPVEEGELGYRSDTIPNTSKHKHLGPSIVLGLTKWATGEPQDCLDKEVGMEDPTDFVVDARRQSCVDDNKDLLLLENKFDIGNTDNLACTERSLWERKSDIGEDSLSAYGLVGTPHGVEENLVCLKSREIQVAKKSSLPEIRFSSVKVDSWPQFKRRKVEDQLTNCFSASPSFRVQKLHSTRGKPISRYLKGVENDLDTVLKFRVFPLSHEEDVSLSNVNKSSDVGIYPKMTCHLTNGIESSPNLHIEEDELGSEERNKGAETPSTFKDKQSGPSPASSLTKLAAGDSRGCLVEDVRTECSTSNVLDAEHWWDGQDYQHFLHLENKVNLVNADNLTCTEGTLQDRKSHRIEDGLLSYCSIGSQHNNDLDLSGSDQTLPVFEGFLLDAQTENGVLSVAGDRINFGKLDLPSTTPGCASALEQIYRPASMHTTLSHFSPTFEPSVPNVLHESMDPRSVDEVDSTFPQVSHSDCLPYSGARLSWNSNNIYTSPVRKFWQRNSFNSGSSEKRLNFNPELTCFRIEEDPSISEENEDASQVADKIHEGIGSNVISCAKRERLAEITQACLNPPASVSRAEKFHDRGSLDSVNTEISFAGTHNRVKQKLRNHDSNKRTTNEAKENQTLPLRASSIKKANESIHNRFSKPKLSGKKSLRKGGQRLLEKESTPNNIISNITSFVPLIQQKQAAAVCTGKRDIKVRALEIAEAAKCLEEKRENERKMKKEALKLERARIEEENLRQRELNKKKKEQVQEKTDADIASRKRLRELEERKEKDRKRKRIAEALQPQRVQEEKLCAGKVEKEKQNGNKDEKVNIRKESDNRSGKDQKKVKESRNNSILKIPETELRIDGVLTSDARQASIVLEDCDAFTGCNDNRKAMSILDQLAENGDLVSITSQEKSYEISPYHCSDDEEEEEDDLPTKKFIPSWASSPPSEATFEIVGRVGGWLDVASFTFSALTRTLVIYLDESFFDKKRF